MIPFAEVLCWGSTMAARQLSLAETLLDPRHGSNARLEAIDAAIDRGPVERLALTVHPGETGRDGLQPAPGRRIEDGMTGEGRQNHADRDENAVHGDRSGPKTPIPTLNHQSYPFCKGLPREREQMRHPRSYATA